MAQPIVLVHGAWHGAWCWYRLVPALRSRGLAPVTPDLPGHGADRTQPRDCTFAGYVARIAEVIDATDGPVTLVGHSFAGLVISQVAEARHDRIKRLVYLAAFLPANGDSCATLGPPDPDSELARGSAVVAEGSAIAVSPDAAAHVFYHDCAPADVALAGRLLVPEPLEPLLAPVALTNERAARIPRTYIGCENDRVIAIGQQRWMWERASCSRVATLATGHSPFFADPQALADLLAAE